MNAANRWAAITRCIVGSLGTFVLTRRRTAAALRHSGPVLPLLLLLLLQRTRRIGYVAGRGWRGGGGGRARHHLPVARRLVGGLLRLAPVSAFVGYRIGQRVLWAVLRRRAPATSHRTQDARVFRGSVGHLMGGRHSIDGHLRVHVRVARRDPASCGPLVLAILLVYWAHL